MRASAVKTAIVDAIEAITTLDSDAGGEAFVSVDKAGPEDYLPERGFAVELVAIVPPSLMTHDNQIARYMIRVFYSAHPAVEDRISDDAERIVQKLYNLHTTASSGDLYAIALDEAGIGPGPVENTYEATFPVAVTYRLTGV